MWNATVSPLYYFIYVRINAVADITRYSVFLTKEKNKTALHQQRRSGYLINLDNTCKKLINKLDTCTCITVKEEDTDDGTEYLCKNAENSLHGVFFRSSK